MAWHWRLRGPQRLPTQQLAAGARRQWLADRLWLHGQPAGVLVFDTPQDVPELIRSLSGQQPAPC